MHKQAVAFLVLALLAAPAAAKNKPDPRTQAMLDCAAIADGTARLACYDRAIGGVRQAIDEGGKLVIKDSSAPRAMAGTVRASGSMGINRYWIELDSGERWEVISTSSHDKAPPTGVQVKFRKGVFGNYWISEPSAPDRRALYLGRKS